MSVESPNPEFEQVVQLLKEKNPRLEFEVTWYVNEGQTQRYLNIEPWGYGPMLETGLRYALVMGYWRAGQFQDEPLEWEEVDENNVVTVWATAIQQRIVREDGVIVWSHENDKEQLADLETLKRIL